MIACNKIKGISGKIPLLKKTLTLIFSMLSINANAAGMESNVRIKVNVVSEACNISNGDENLTLDFGSVIKKYIYINKKTIEIPFSINLVNCNPDIAKTISVKFTGDENNETPGLLAISPSSTAKGIAIGIEDEKGNLLKINKDISKQNISKGSTSLNFRAYIQGIPSALINNTVYPGLFYATTTYILTYN